MTEEDVVNSPSHYTSHPSGIECIEITEHMGFNLGNAFKYLARLGLKDDTFQDLKKARWYIDRELDKREGDAPSRESRKDKIDKWCAHEDDDRMANIYESLWLINEWGTGGTGTLFAIRSIIDSEVKFMESER